MIPYTYLLKFKPTNRFYYGVRFSKNCHPNDFFIKYFTSSSEIKNLIDKFGLDSFEFEIRKIFNSANKARIWEHKVLRRLKVLKNNKWINKTDNISIYVENPKEKYHLWWNSLTEKEQNTINKKKANIGIKNGMYGRDRSGKNNPRFGVTLSEDIKNKISESNKGKKANEKQKLSMSIASKRYHESENGKEDMKKRSILYKKIGKIPPSPLGMLWWKKDGINIRSKECPGEGWSRGRIGWKNE